MSNITNFNWQPALEFASSAAQTLYGQAGENPTVAAFGVGTYFLCNREDPDLRTLREVAQDIKDLNVTIGDGNAYDFVKAHKQYVNKHKTVSGSIAMLAAGLRSRARGSRYGENPVDIVELGDSVYKNKSGQCDHMAAAVVSGVVKKIREGRPWNSRLEVVGNGGHAFVLKSRAEGSDLHRPSTWGSKAASVDTWLAQLGATKESGLVEGENGVVSKPADIQSNMAFFGADRLRVTHDFSAEILHKIAKPPKD